MPKPKPENEKSAAVDKRRKDAFEKFFGLTEKALEHIKWSLGATQVCQACVFVDGQGFKAGKAKTADGLCAMCGNTGVVPDKTQRNWATQEVAERIAPKPKAVEMTVDKAEERKELETQVSKLEDTVLDLQLKALGVNLEEIAPE